MNGYIYADNAATTPMNEYAREEMLRAAAEYSANPSSLHALGRRAAAYCEELRERLSVQLGCRPREAVFTSGGTEGNVYGLTGAAHSARRAGKGHIIVSAIEHHSVTNTAKALEKEGFAVTYLLPDGSGRFSPDALADALREDTALVSVGLVNNEIGTVQDIPALAAAAHRAGALFHCDCVAAAPHMKIDVQALGADMLSLSGHKFGAPVGVGLLWVRSGTDIDNLLHGGAQQYGRRPGTVPVALWAGFVRALEENFSTLDSREPTLREQRQQMVDHILKNIPNVRINGGEKTVGGILSLSFPDIVGEEMMMLLDRDGIGVSTGSACASGGGTASHVISALGLDRKYSSGTLRLSFYSPLRTSEIGYILQRIVHNAQLIRNVDL